MEIDLSYSLGIINKLISFGSNPELGFHTSGSAAEFAAADFLFEECKRIGMKQVRKEAVPADNFEFKHADLSYKTHTGEKRQVTLSAFQTNCLFEHAPIRIVYVGKGRTTDYESLDVSDAFVLVDINMKDEWAGCWPLEEARNHGAAGIILVQTEGYCSYSHFTLGIQGIATTADFPALTLSVHDANLLKEELLLHQNSIPAVMTADVRVTIGGITHNVIAEIPGQIPEVIYLIGHYDAYFRAFSDNASGIGCILGICRALLKSGYQPKRTLRVILHGAEEWGVTGTRYHWARGAFMETQKHPEWGENGFFLLNLDGAVCCGTADKAVVRTSYSAEAGVRALGENIAPTCYPFGTMAPMWTWTESYMYASLGIPTMESFYEGKGADFWPSYHSSSDTIEAANYSDEAFHSSHVLYGTLLQRLDALPVRDMDFGAFFKQLQNSLEKVPAEHEQLENILNDLIPATQKLKEIQTSCTEFTPETLNLNRHIASLFRLAFRGLYSIDWNEQLNFLHMQNLHNIRQLDSAIRHVQEEQWKKVIREDLDSVDLCRYAFSFGRQAYDKLAAQVIGEQVVPTWGSGQVTSLADLYDCCQELNRLSSGNNSSEKGKDWILEKLHTEKEKQLIELKIELQKELKVLQTFQTQLHELIH